MDKKQRVESLSTASSSTASSSSSSSSSSDSKKAAAALSLHACFPFLDSPALAAEERRSLKIVEATTRDPLHGRTFSDRVFPFANALLNGPRSEGFRLLMMASHVQWNQARRGWLVLSRDLRGLAANLVAAGFAVSPTSLQRLLSQQLHVSTNSGDVYRLQVPEEAYLRAGVQAWLPDAGRHWDPHTGVWLVYKSARQQLCDMVQFLDRLASLDHATRWHLFGDEPAEAKLLRWPRCWPDCLLAPLLPLPLQLHCHVASFLPERDVFRLSRTCTGLKELLTRAASFCTQLDCCSCPWYRDHNICLRCEARLHTLEARALTHKLCPGHVAIQQRLLANQQAAQAPR